MMSGQFHTLAMFVVFVAWNVCVSWYNVKDENCEMFLYSSNLTFLLCGMYSLFKVSDPNWCAASDIHKCTLQVAPTLRMNATTFARPPPPPPAADVICGQPVT